MKGRNSRFAFFRVARASQGASEARLAKLPGQPAGTLVHIGAQREEEMRLELFDYGGENVDEQRPDSLGEIRPRPDAEGVRWLDISGLHEVEELAAIGEHFGVSSLVLEDVLNTSCRPKIEEFAGGLFVLLRLLTVDMETKRIDLQQVSFVLLEDNVLLSFSEVATPVFEPIRERIRTGGAGRIRKFGADYLLWALLDVVVDHYLRVAHQMDEALGDIDDQLQQREGEVSAADINRLKSEATRLYRHIRPCREIAGILYRVDSPLIAEPTRPFLRDLLDHSVEVVEASEDLRETASALRDFYQTAMGNRMNEIMKVLTCFSTIFLPLTFLAGIYGMNFEHMPELKWPWSYGVLWFLFAVTAAGMFWFFRRKRWL